MVHLKDKVISEGLPTFCRMREFDIDTRPEVMTTYLMEVGLLEAEDQVLSINKAGDGNMNVVLRVQCNSRALVIKQARPYVNRYPSIAAPLNRTVVERTYYQSIQPYPLIRGMMPRILYSSAEDCLIVLEDLGPLADLTSLYHQSARFTADTAGQLVDYLLRLHHDVEPSTIRSFPDNLELRRLNHEHLFRYPYQENNGLDLDQVTPGLARVSLPFRRDQELRRRADELGSIYLGRGASLLHGDFYPGSWFQKGEKIFVLDPEFAFAGPPEFDVGVMVGHFFLMGLSESVSQQVVHQYVHKSTLDEMLTYRFAGMEILRRLIGLAQLPLALDLPEKRDLLDKARIFMLS